MYLNKIKLPNISAFYKNSTYVVKTKNEEANIKIINGKVSSVYYKTILDKKFIKLSKKSFKTRIIGKDNFKRKVIHFLYPKNKKFKLRLGITHHSKLSSWSSLPHKFETNLERGFEEFFFYLLKNSPKTAIQVGQGVWYNSKKVSKSWLVKDKTFSVIPMGYHPVVGLPNVKVSYIWAYIAKYKRWEKI